MAGMVAKPTGKEDKARDFALEKYRLDRAHELELNRATANYEQETLRMLSYLNGGAALLYSGFIGNLASDKAITLAVAHLAPVIVWSLGLLATMMSLWLMYESQVKFTQAYHARRRAEEKRSFEGFPQYANVTDPKKKAENYDSEAEGHVDEGRRIKKLAKLAGLSAVLLFIAGLMTALWAMGIFA